MLSDEESYLLEVLSTKTRTSTTYHHLRKNPLWEERFYPLAILCGSRLYPDFTLYMKEYYHNNLPDYYELSLREYKQSSFIFKDHSKTVSNLPEIDFTLLQENVSSLPLHYDSLYLKLETMKLKDILLYLHSRKIFRRAVKPEEEKEYELYFTTSLSHFQDSIPSRLQIISLIKKHNLSKKNGEVSVTPYGSFLPWLHSSNPDTTEFYEHLKDNNKFRKKIVSNYEWWISQPEIAYILLQHYSPVEVLTIAETILESYSEKITYTNLESFIKYYEQGYPLKWVFTLVTE